MAANRSGDFACSYHSAPLSDDHSKNVVLLSFSFLCSQRACLSAYFTASCHFQAVHSLESRSRGEHRCGEIGQAQVDALPADETIRIIYGLAARKQTAEAAGMLKQLIADHGYDASCALAQARISAASGDFTAARVLYEKAKTVWDDSAPREYNAVTEACASRSVDTVLLAHLDSSDIADLAPEGVPDTGDTGRPPGLCPTIWNRPVPAGTPTTHRAGSRPASPRSSDTFRPAARRMTAESVAWRKIWISGMTARGIFLKQVQEARMRLKILQGDYSSIAADLTDESGIIMRSWSPRAVSERVCEKSDFAVPPRPTMKSLRTVTGQRKISMPTTSQTETSGRTVKCIQNYKKTLPCTAWRNL